MKIFLLVAAGGFLGAISRYLLTNLIKSRHNKPFPFETFLINLTGSFLLGFLAGHEQFPKEIYLFLGTGFMGAYTTFSTFELEAAELIRKDKLLVSLVYLISSAAMGVILAYLGFHAGKVWPA